ncbi:MAG: T9SS type A sorting domain-containing protein [Flavobacteriales bacterium]
MCVLTVWLAYYLRLGEFVALSGNALVAAIHEDVFSIDTRRPFLDSVDPATTVINDAVADADGWSVQLTFSEDMDPAVQPHVAVTSLMDASSSLLYAPDQSSWTDARTFEAVFQVLDLDVEANAVDLAISLARDLRGNRIQAQTPADLNVLLDTRNPRLLSMQTDPSVITDAHVGPNGLTLSTTFDEAMDPGSAPIITFPEELSGSLIPDPVNSIWSNTSTHQTVIGVQASIVSISGVDMTVAQARDMAGNVMVIRTLSDVLDVNLTGVGIDDIRPIDPLVLAPNPVPSGGTLRIRTADAAAVDEVRVMDAAGRVVLEEGRGMSSGGLLELALPNLSAGVYELVLIAGIHRHTGRIIILAP